MVKRTLALVISFLIFIFVMFIVLEIVTGEPFTIHLILYFVAIFVVLNSRRYIKHKKWYINPIFLAPSFFDEEAMKDIAWGYLIFGIIFLIYTIYICFAGIFEMIFG